MELKLNKLSVMNLFLAFSLLSCEKMDIADMFVTKESANQRFEQSLKWNEEHPAREIVVPSDEYMILSFADSHVGSTNDLDDFFKTAIKTKAAAVVMVGDLTSGNEKDYSLFQQHLPCQDSLISFPVTGNHDLWFDGWNQYYIRFGSSTYLFTVKTQQANDLFICLDSGSGTLGDKQFKWLRNNLQVLRPQYRHCIVFTHDNFFRNRHTTSTNPVIEEVTALMELFAENNVDMVVAGHDHEQYSTIFGKTTYIVMDALLDGFKNSGYFQIVMSNGDIGHKFIRL
jgi:UDP-2,3-diacylglucosamine pyrophosphatase LpxH